MKPIKTGKKKRKDNRIKAARWDSKRFKQKVADKSETFFCICFIGETPVTETIAVAAENEEAARSYFKKRSQYAGYKITKVTPVPQQ